jgi:hypothetical protein
MYPRIVKTCGFLIALAGALFFSGCATITRGTNEQLSIQSEPSGANVRLSNGFTGVTPATFTVPRKGDIFLTVSKDGYVSSELTLYSKLSGNGTVGFLGNALIGGIIGGGVDIATGATLSHVPNPVNVKLVPKPAPVPVMVATPSTSASAPASIEPAKAIVKDAPPPAKPENLAADSNAPVPAPVEPSKPAGTETPPTATAPVVPPANSPAQPPPAAIQPETKTVTDSKPDDSTKK